MNVLRPIPAFFFASTSLIALSTSYAAVDSPTAGGDIQHGKTLFTQSCALCHTSALGLNHEMISGQGPSLVGIFGRHAAATKFNYTQALTDSGITWNAGTLDHFLFNPAAAVPGTSMPAAVPSPTDRQDLVAYLATLASAPGDRSASASASTGENQASPAANASSGDWHDDAPGVVHSVKLSQLPAPFSTSSAGNSPKVVKRPADGKLSVPEGFALQLLASDLSGPRLLRVAPNGDIFISETRSNRIRVLRMTPGKESPTHSEIFADGLDRPFGIAFYPTGENPQWVYVANNNSVVRYPYKSGDLKARGEAETIVPTLCEGSGGHSTRDIAISKDNRRLFISVGSGSNVAEEMPKKSVEEIRAWETAHGRGASWGPEANRADILVTTPEKGPVHTFATGIRNGVGIAVDPNTGELWTSTNERDGLGDDLVPDYITHVQEGGYYGWPWYYMGNHEDPRHAGERPDLTGQAIVPDVPLQPHSASLEMVFYPTNAVGAAAFPKEYQGDVFAALHGSWNRSSRTGYKVVRVRFKNGAPTGEYEDFLTGFIVDADRVWGRPVGVAIAKDGALLVTEDGNSTLWRIAPSGK